jgi:GH24 family phage-related lysozyme (muramidase)
MAIEILRRRPPSDHIVTDQAIDLIRGFEGLHLKAYPDPASPLAKTGKGSGDPWTIGWGHTKGVKPGDTCTLDQANAWLREDADEAADIVRNNVNVPLTAGEMAALVSLAYNLGYIPPSLKACLNGGVTDKGKVMTPGSYGSAMLQFLRNNRAAGRVMPGLYRRRLAEICVFSDLPWENACSPTVVKVKFDASGEIDPNESTSLEDTLMRARLDTSKPPDTSHILKKQWSELVKPEPVKAEPVAAEAPGDAEPAEKEAPQPNPPPLVSAPVPAPPSGPVVAGPAVVVPAPQPPPPPVAAPKPPEPVIIAPKTVDVKSIPYGEVDPGNGAKNMTDSQRGIGMVIVGAGSLIQIITTRLGIGTAVGAIAFDLSRDPVVIALAATAVVAAIGWFTRKRGTKVMTKGMIEARTLLK